MPVADVNGAQINYRFDGPEGAPVLMLSNSLGTDLGMWEPQIASFATKLTVLRYDSRGHGGSAVTPGPYTLAQLARDALGLLDRLRIEQAHFCGLSMGGMVGMWLGAHAPERVAKLILCNTAAQIGSPDPWNARIEAVRKGGMAAIEAGVLARWFTPGFLERSPPILGRMRETLLRLSPDGYTACCAAVRDMDQRETLSRIGAPTLVIAGTHDAATPPAAGRFIAERVKGAQYVELEAAHISNVEVPDRFAESVLRFLGK